LQRSHRPGGGRPDQRDGGAPLVPLRGTPRSPVSPIDKALHGFWHCARQRPAPGPEWMKRLSREEAYRVQLGVLARYVAAGERQAGWKVGLTSKAMQAQQGVHEPVLGFLLQSGERPSGTRFTHT